MMIRRFGLFLSIAASERFARRSRHSFSVLACVLALVAAPSQGAQVLLEPTTTGTYSWNWIDPPVNQSYGFDRLAPVQAGAHQKGTITRNYRSYMTFDTLGSQSSILSATLELIVIRRQIDNLPSPTSKLELTLGLPRAFSPQEMADPSFTAQPPHAMNIYNDLATNGFAQIFVPFGDMIQPIQQNEFQLTIPMPLAFVAAFNQARASTRYLPVSIFGGDYGLMSVDFSVNSRLVVNNLTPVPEPLSLSCLTIGLAILAFRKTIGAPGS